MNAANSTPVTHLLMSGQAFAHFANGLSEDQFYRQPNGKWSVADAMQHLFLSARPVARLLAGPRAVFQQWGQPDGPARSYDEIADAYRQALTTGIKAPAPLSPRPDDSSDGQVIARFTKVYESLAAAASTWSADDLDRFILPHPALGKLTLREMLDFTDIHTRHHLRIVQAQWT